MADKIKSDEPGLVKKGLAAIGDLAWKIMATVGGKDGADLSVKSLTAYSKGEFREGLNFASEANKKTAEHISEAVTHSVVKAEDLISGGHHVSDKDSAQLTPKSSAAHSQTAPKR